MRVERRCRLVENRNAWVFHQHFRKPEALTHALRKRADPRAPDLAQSDPSDGSIETLVDLLPSQPGEAPGIGEIVAGREAVVKPDLIRQIAHPTLDFERSTQRVEAGHFGAA